MARRIGEVEEALHQGGGVRGAEGSEEGFGAINGGISMEESTEEDVKRGAGVGGSHEGYREDWGAEAGSETGWVGRPSFEAGEAFLNDGWVVSGAAKGDGGFVEFGLLIGLTRAVVGADMVQNGRYGGGGEVFEGDYPEVRVEVDFQCLYKAEDFRYGL